MNMSELRRLQGKNATMAYCFALGAMAKLFPAACCHGNSMKTPRRAQLLVRWARILCETEN